MDLIYKTRNQLSRSFFASGVLAKPLETLYIESLGKNKLGPKAGGNVVDLGDSSGYHCMVCSNLGM